MKRFTAFMSALLNIWKTQSDKCVPVGRCFRVLDPCSMFYVSVCVFVVCYTNPNQRAEPRSETEKEFIESTLCWILRRIFQVQQDIYSTRKRNMFSVYSWYSSEQSNAPNTVEPAVWMVTPCLLKPTFIKNSFTLSNAFCMKPNAARIMFFNQLT